jgi:hypothetical protein
MLVSLAAFENKAKGYRRKNAKNEAFFSPHLTYPSLYLIPVVNSLF